MYVWVVCLPVLWWVCLRSIFSVGWSVGAFFEGEKGGLRVSGRIEVGGFGVGVGRVWSGEGVRK